MSSPGRVYSVSFTNVSISAVQDLFSIINSASTTFELHEFAIYADAATTLAQLRVLIKRCTASWVIGSGGSAATFVRRKTKDSATSLTGRTNDTARATGTFETWVPKVVNELNGLEFLPAPEDRPCFNVSEQMVIGLEVAPGSATVFDGYCLIEETM